MEPERLRVYNRSQDSLLRLAVYPVETTKEPLKRVVERLAMRDGSGLWMRHYRGIPQVPGVPPLDLVYLDDDNRVVQEVDSYPRLQERSLNPRVTSALVLPAHTVFASQVEPGDALVIASQEEIDRLIGALPGGHRRSSGSKRGTGHTPSQVDDHAGQVRSAIRQLKGSGVQAPERPPDSRMARLLQWLSQSPADRQRMHRYPLPALVAYHWMNTGPAVYHVGDMSGTGCYLLTEERPAPGTVILMTLQRTGADGESLGESIVVQAVVIRWGPDGVGMKFHPAKSADGRRAQHTMAPGASKQELDAFLKRLRPGG